jgi:hypothetical protein
MQQQRLESKPKPQDLVKFSGQSHRPRAGLSLDLISILEVETGHRLKLLHRP